MYFVYILHSQENKRFYTGSTSNLKERLKYHKRKNVKTTMNSRYKLYWYCGFKNKEKAYSFERYLKTGSGIAFRNKHILSQPSIA